jgi:hypothetical protein
MHTDPLPTEYGGRHVYHPTLTTSMMYIVYIYMQHMLLVHVRVLHLTSAIAVTVAIGMAALPNHHRSHVVHAMGFALHRTSRTLCPICNPRDANNISQQRNGTQRHIISTQLDRNMMP